MESARVEQLYVSIIYVIYCPPHLERGMAFTLDASGPYIRVTITESVTGQDIGEIGRRIAELEVGLKVIPHRIVDTTGMTGGGDTGYRDVSSFMASRAKIQ